MLAVLGCALLCSGQQPDPCLERRILVVPTAVGPKAASEFSGERIRGEVHGKPVSIIGLTPFAGRRRTVVLLDASGSMKNKWATVLAITANLIKSAPDDVSIAMVSYSDKFEDVVNFSQHSRSDIEQRVLEYGKRDDFPRGSSPLLAAISRAADLLQPAQFGDSILFITDAGEDEERERVETVRRRLIAAGIRLFSILFADATPRTEGERSWVGILEKLAEETGGWHMITDNPGPAAANSFITSINENRGLSLVVRLPGPIPQWQKWKLFVVDVKGKPSTKTTLSYPRFLSPCEQRN